MSNDLISNTRKNLREWDLGLHGLNLFPLVALFCLLGLVKYDFDIHVRQGPPDSEYS